MAPRLRGPYPRETPNTVTSAAHIERRGAHGNEHA